MHACQPVVGDQNQNIKLSLPIIWGTLKCILFVLSQYSHTLLGLVYVLFMALFGDCSVHKKTNRGTSYKELY